MTRPLILTLAAAAACLLAAAPASARPHHRRAFVRHDPDVPTFGGRREVLETSPQGDRIISGRIGMHQNHFTSDLVPDSDGPDLILSGRASRSGVLGANGVPKSNGGD